jgi:DNA-binding response OmpR family regulator
MKIAKTILGKRILIVDDEKDILETLAELLVNCKIDMANSYEQAVILLDENYYDLAILDIMGVDGYGLLDKAKEKDIPAIMLTAHALSADNLVRSVEEGAVYYAPKEELINIEEIAAEVIEAIENKKSTWERMMTRLADSFDKKFNGPDWRDKVQKAMNKLIDV